MTQIQAPPFIIAPMDFSTVATQVIILFLIILVGFAARRASIVSDTTVDVLSGLIFKVFIPCLLITSLLKPFSIDLLIKSGQILLISFFVYALSFGLALILPKLFRWQPGQRGVFQVALMFSNVGFMGYPVLLAIYGNDSIFFGAIYNIPFNLLLYSLGVFLLSQHHEDIKKSSLLAGALNPATIAILVGFTMFVLSIKLPDAVFAALSQIGSVTTPISMLTIGAILGAMDFKRIWSNPQVYVVSALRLVGMPLLFYALLHPVISDYYLRAIPVTIASMPAATMIPILARNYNGDAESASKVIFISTLFSIITIPLIATLLN